MYSARRRPVRQAKAGGWARSGASGLNQFGRWSAKIRKGREDQTAQIEIRVGLCHGGERAITDRPLFSPCLRKVKREREQLRTREDRLSDRSLVRLSVASLGKMLNFIGGAGSVRFFCVVQSAGRKLTRKTPAFATPKHPPQPTLPTHHGPASDDDSSFSSSSSSSRLGSRLGLAPLPDPRREPLRQRLPRARLPPGRS